MSALEFRIDGLEELATRLEALASADEPIRDLSGKLFRAGEKIMAVSKRLVPVDTGALRASGFVELPEIQGDRVSVTLAYGGPAADYAVPVHENLQARHTVGQAKYLEEPFLAAREGVLDELREALRAAILARAT